MITSDIHGFDERHAFTEHETQVRLSNAMTFLFFLLKRLKLKLVVIKNTV